MVNDRYIGSDIDRISKAGEVVVQTASQAIQGTGQLTDQYLKGLSRQASSLADLNDQQLTIQRQLAEKGGTGLQGLVNAGLSGINLYQQIEQKRYERQKKDAEIADKKEKDLYERQVDEQKWQRQLEQDEIAFAEKLYDRQSKERDFEFKVASAERDFAYKQVQDANEQQKFLIRREDEIEKERRQQLSTVAATDAWDKISNLEAKYLSSEDGFLTNASQYKAEAIAVLAGTTGLSANDYKVLMERINEKTNSRLQMFNSRLISEQDKLSQANADKSEAQFNIELLPILRQIKNLPNSEQAAPYLGQLTDKIKQFLASKDNGLTDSQKLTIAARTIKNASDSYGIKLDNYQTVNRDLKNFNDFALAYQALLVKYKQDGKYDEFKDSVGQLKIKYGDWTSNLAQLGEAEKTAYDIANNNAQLDQLRRNAATEAAKGFVLSDYFGNYVAANLLLNPNFDSQLRAYPGLIDKPEVKMGIKLAERIREARTAYATLGTDFAATNTKISQLQLNKVSSLTSVVQRIALQRQQGKPLDIADQLVQQELANYAAANPNSQLMSLLGGVFNNPEVKPDMDSINRALTDEQSAISVIQGRLLEESKAKQEEFNTRYADVIQVFGKIPTDKEISSWLNVSKSSYEAEFEKFKTKLKEAEANAVPNYGIQPNFSQGSQYGASVDPNGLVTIAPQSVAQTMTRNGKRIVIPTILAGKAVVTGRHGDPRGGGRRKHAGADFSSTNGNHKNISLVSGTVMWVGNMSGYGGMVDILGDNGYIYRYAHQAVSVKRGDRVKPGQVVGTSNGSGINLGRGDTRHLHFEVRTVNNPAGIRPENYTPATGFGGTIDPLQHLEQLSAGNSNVRKPRLNNVRTSRTTGGQIAPGNSFPTSNNGMLRNMSFGVPGKSPVPANTVYGSQRPVTTSGNKNQYAIVSGSLPQSTWEVDNWGYEWLQKNPTLATAIARTAKKLGVPPWWITDIIAQESGNFRLAMKQHPGAVNRNYGMFGFGSDSGVKGFYGADPMTQVRQYEDYMIRNGWLNHMKKTGGRVNIAQFWAITRMGTNWRRQILNGRDPSTLKLNDTGYTYMGEIGLLGKHVGRRYVNGGQATNQRGNRNTNRRGRNKAVKTSFNPNSSIAVGLMESGTDGLPYLEETLV